MLDTSFIGTFGRLDYAVKTIKGKRPSTLQGRVAKAFAYNFGLGAVGAEDFPEPVRQRMVEAFQIVKRGPLSLEDAEGVMFRILGVHEELHPLMPGRWTKR